MDLPRVLLVHGFACLEVSVYVEITLTDRAWKVPSLPYDDLHPLADYDRAIYLYKVSDPFGTKLMFSDTGSSWTLSDVNKPG